MKKINCKQCNWKWGVSAMVSETNYLCPCCRRQLMKLCKKESHSQNK